MWRIIDNIETPFEKGDAVYFNDDAFLYESDLERVKKTIDLIGYCDKNTDSFYWTGTLFDNVDTKDPFDGARLVQMNNAGGSVIRVWVYADKIKHLRVE